VKIHGVADVLIIEDTEAAAEDPIGIRRVRDADARREILVLGLHQPVAEQAVAARRGGLRPYDVEARIRIRALALANKVRIIALGSPREEVDVRQINREEVALGIQEWRRQFVPQ